MKLKTLALSIAACALVGGFTSCKKSDKNSSASDEVQTTFELSGNQAIADNTTEDANSVFMEAAADNNLTGGRPMSPEGVTGNLGCATVTVSTGAFPKTMVIDFGTGCTSPQGVTRSGKINVTISDSVRKSGSVAVLTFDNYYVNGYKKEGTVTWTNTTTGANKSWQRKMENGKITAPDGKYWLHSGTQNIEQITGSSTPFNVLDDTFSTTGNATVTNAAGKTRTSEITEALIKQTSCDNIGKGKIKTQGPNHFSILDFGDGTCDRIATITIDNYPSITIVLR